MSYGVLLVTLTMQREISTLLARSFFMKFSLTILAVLARIRVLVQQVSICPFPCHILAGAVYVNLFPVFYDWYIFWRLVIIL